MIPRSDWQQSFRNRVIKTLGYVAGPLHARRSFTFAGAPYSYCSDFYNNSWANERCVEVPIAKHYLERHTGKRILEVGNVMCHYMPTAHDVVDKYEQATGVQNVDVLDFHAEQPYDLIVSISTFEHFGWDEDVKDPDKAIKALEHLADMLTPTGELLVTVPLGPNPNIDRNISSGALRFDELRFLKRISFNNRWCEVTKAEIKDAQYGSAYKHANAIAVGVRRAQNL